MRATVLTAVFAILLNTVCQAACEFGKTPAWSDVEAVRYVRTGCFGKCPNYEVSFSRHGFSYVGYKCVEVPGTYEPGYNQSTFDKVIGTLQLHNFFAMNYDSAELVLDAPHLIVAVARCGVTTKFDWPWHGDRKDVPSLLDGLDAIAKTVPWHKTSDNTESLGPSEFSAP